MGFVQMTASDRLRFSDDDLKEMQSRLDPKGVRAVVGYRIDKWRALLARLEAAERVVSLATQYTLIADVVVPIGDAVKAWRQATGRD